MREALAAKAPLMEHRGREVTRLLDATLLLCEGCGHEGASAQCMRDACVRVVLTRPALRRTAAR